MPSLNNAPLRGPTPLSRRPVNGVPLDPAGTGFEITSVPRGDLFTITAPGGDTTGAITEIWKLTGLERVLIHDNSIELYAGAPSPAPVGIYLHDHVGTHPPHGRVIVRGNRFR